MVKLAYSLMAVVLVLSVMLPGCTREEDPYGPMYDVHDVLREKLQLTDEQMEIAETGTGVLQLTAEEVDIIRDPVEQLLIELEPLLDEARWQEVRQVFGRLLTDGEADLESLSAIAEELQGLEPWDEVEVITRLEKLPETVGSSLEPLPLAAGLSDVTTVYTPSGTPPEIDEGDEHINLEWVCERDIGFGEPNTGAETNCETGGLFTYSWSWVGVDGATALLGIEFEVPADNTDVSITTTMKYISATTSIVSGFAGTYIATRFADESVRRYRVIDSPFDWKKILDLLCLAFGPYVSWVKYVSVVSDAGSVIIDGLNFVDLAQALGHLEGAEENEIVYNAGSLSKGSYRFYIGLHARTSSAIVGFAHAAAYGQVSKIKVTQSYEEPIPECVLSIGSTAGGTVTSPGEGTFSRPAGAVVNLVATPDAGYEFVSWTGEVGTVANVNAASTTITMNDNYSITANFEQIPAGQVTLTISRTSGGSVSTPGLGTFPYDAGTVVNLVATPASGYRFVKWTGDVGTIANVNAASTTITMNGDYSITANFVRQYNLTISSTAGGTVTTPGTGTFTYDKGTVVAVVATPDPGCEFIRWTSNWGGIIDVDAASTTVTMNGDYPITANFGVEVWDWYGLDAIRGDLDGYYLLMSDLDSSSAGYEELAGPTANGGKGWEPIGTWSPSAFTGSFDGQGHEIRDLFIDRPAEDCVGLFGYYDPSSYAFDYIKNLGLVDATVHGRSGVGGLVGRSDGELSDTYFVGSVVGSWDDVGGLVGENTYPIYRCHSAGNVTGVFGVGGLTGDHSNTFMDDCYSTADVSGDLAVGGLVGYIGACSYISDSYFGGTVVGNRGAGGLVGIASEPMIYNSFYNYDDVLINGQNVLTIGALFGGDFEDWLSNGKFLDVNDRLSLKDGYYVIADIADFKQMLAFGWDDSLKFRLTGDLDLAGEPNFYIPYLDAEFDGNGHVIRNLSFNFDFVSQVGLFGFLGYWGEVRELGAENVDVVGYSNVGGLLGGNGGTVINSYSTGAVAGTQDVGGLVGQVREAVSDCYSTASVTGSDSVGGLVGSLSSGGVSNSYSSGAVSGTYYVGGLVGWNWESPVTNSFWDYQTSGQGTSDGGTGKTTAQMKSTATFSGAGWNIIGVASSSTRNTSYIWNIVNSATYPFLSWQSIS
jgi:hypothetical protein